MTLTFHRPTPALEELVDAGQTMQTLARGLGFTEGPVWSPSEQVLRFSDISGDTRYRWSEQGGVEVDLRPNRKGNGMVHDAAGNLLVCEHASSALVRFGADGRRVVVVDRYRGMELNSPNDVVTRSDGSVYFSDPTYGRMDGPHGVAREPSPLGFQGVFRVPPGGGEAELVVRPAEFSQPNGLCFSPDEKFLYVDDLTGVRCFEVATDGSLGPARVVRGDMSPAAHPGRAGGPDGMRCDEQGNLWCTGPGGVWVLRPDGELLGVIATPEVCANLVWGGPDWRTLFLTTSTSLRSLRTRVGPAPLPYH